MVSQMGLTYIHIEKNIPPSHSTEEHVTSVIHNSTTWTILR